MLTPATGCSKQCPPHKVRALHQGDWFLLGPTTHTQALFIVVPGIARRASASGISQGTPTCKPTWVGGSLLISSSSTRIGKGRPGPIKKQSWRSLPEPLYQAIQGDDPHQCITAWVVDEKAIASMIMWWEPLQRVSQSSHGKISSPGLCLLDVWDDNMLTLTTGFRPMCGMAQCSSPPQAFT